MTQPPAVSAKNAGTTGRYTLAAGMLSYLIPGLGQIFQGRVGKGILFLVCLYGLFFYGMYLDDWKNVYIPEMMVNYHSSVPEVVNDIYNRPQFAGQFWIGIAAWPAIWQYCHLPVPSSSVSPALQELERMPSERVINQLQTEGDKTWDLGWVFTVIAGVLNVLVIYDAAAGPAVQSDSHPVHFEGK
jgi:hypothetical protein